MDGWDIAVLLVGGFVAATALVRLMIHRRNQLVNQLLRESQNEQQRQPPPKASSEGRNGP
jgi:ribosomal 50S subunit-associated protein YjgA (DUF615 family)